MNNGTKAFWIIIVVCAYVLTGLLIFDGIPRAPKSLSPTSHTATDSTLESLIVQLTIAQYGLVMYDYALHHNLAIPSNVMDSLENDVKVRVEQMMEQTRHKK